MPNNKNQDVMSLGALIEEKEKEFKGKDDFLGITLMTFVQYISSTRSTMFVNHMKQYNVLNHPEPPRIFTGYERMFGEHSSALVKAESDYEVFAKVEKFEDFPGHIYMLFLYDKENDMYEVVQKKIAEKLTENYGYRYNNDNLDKLKIGDVVEKGDVLYKSTSYDDDNNYCYGINARCGIILVPEVIEDAYVVRRGFCEKMQSIKNDDIMISVNDNDFLLNLYGTSSNYKGFPDIGETVRRRVIAAKRRIINDQILYDMKKSNMMKIQPMSDKPYFTMDGVVVDVDIYSNKLLSEIPEAEYNDQIRYYLRNQNRYYREIVSICEKIVESGSKYSDDIGYVYQRSKQILDPNYRWKDSKNVFSNFMIELHVVRNVNLAVGSKMTGRFGDKGVVSRIIDDDKMPFDEDGKPLDVLVNPLSCPGRLNPFQWIEISINHSSNQIAKQLKKMNTDEERFVHFMKYMKYFNERGEADQFAEWYSKLTDEQKSDVWESIYRDGIYINYPPMWEDRPALEKIEAIRKEFGIERDQLYVRKWGRVIPMMNKLIVGERYMLKLKQTAEKNFSARGTGYLSQKGVPEKSNKVKTNENLYSTTPVAIGRDENNNLGIGVHPFILAKMHLFYRTSPHARRIIGKMFTNNVLKQKKFKIKRDYMNRNVEILNAQLKSIGLKIDFGFDGLRLDLKEETLHEYSWKGKRYIRSREEMREILLDELLRKNYNKKHRKDGGSEEGYQKFKQKIVNEMNGMLVLDI